MKALIIDELEKHLRNTLDYSQLSWNTRAKLHTPKSLFNKMASFSLYLWVIPLYVNNKLQHTVVQLNGKDSVNVFFIIIMIFLSPGIKAKIQLRINYRRRQSDFESGRAL